MSLLKSRIDKNGRGPAFNLRRPGTATTTLSDLVGLAGPAMDGDVRVDDDDDEESAALALCLIALTTTFFSLSTGCTSATSLSRRVDMVTVEAEGM